MKALHVTESPVRIAKLEAHSVKLIPRDVNVVATGAMNGMDKISSRLVYPDPP